jgi:hypothetical protein
MDMKWKAIGGAGCVVVAAGVALSQAAPRKKPAELVAQSAAAKPGNPQAEAVLARLKKDEAAVRSGRLSLLMVRREGEIPADAAGPAASAAIQKRPITQKRREYLLFSGANWRRNVTVTDAQGNVAGEFFLSVNDGLGRMLQKEGHGDDQKVAATVGEPPPRNAAELLLASRGAELLQDVEWTAVKRAATHAELTGTRGEERISVTVRNAPRAAIDRITLTRPQETEQGVVTRTQEVRVTYEASGSGLAPKAIDDLLYVGKPLNRGMLVRHTVEGAQINAAVEEHELHVDIPKGTRIVDTRFEPPFRYPQGDKDLTLAEVKVLREQSVAAVGRMAPDWELKTLEEKTAKLSDYRGKVVLLTWFASW